MAETNVPITAGSGTAIDGFTLTSPANIRQSVVIGDPSTNAAVASVSAAHGLQVDLSNTAANTTAIKVDGSGVTQNVSQQATATISATLQSAATATGVGTVMTVTGMSTVMLTVSGTFVGTITWQASEDGTNFANINATQLGTNTISTTTTGVGTFEIAAGGALTKLQANITAYTSGSITVTAHAAPLPFTAKVINANIQGTVPVSLATNTPTIAAGTNIIGKVTTDQTTHGTTDLVAADLTKINGTAISSANPLFTSSIAPTGQGFTPTHYISAASTNATNVKASAGDIGGIQAYNNTATIGYLKLYDKASAPTVGTDTPIKTILIPANASGSGTNISFASPGISFTSGIGFAITGGIADADTTAVAASAFVINIDSK